MQQATYQPSNEQGNSRCYFMYNKKQINKISKGVVMIVQQLSYFIVC